MTILLAFYSFGGLLLAGLSVPFVLHKIPPNRWYGLRLRSIAGDPRLWYKVNAFVGRRMLTVGIGTAIGSATLYYTNAHSVEQYGMSSLGLFLALFLWAIITSHLFVREITAKFE